MPTMQQQFDVFDAENPAIYSVFVAFAKDLREAGVARIRADEVLHRVRWDLAGHHKDNFVFNELKVLFGNRYAMKLIAEDDSYREFFDLTVAYGN